MVSNILSGNSTEEMRADNARRNLAELLPESLLSSLGLRKIRHQQENILHSTEQNLVAEDELEKKKQKEFELAYKTQELKLNAEQLKVKQDLGKFFEEVREINSIKDADRLESLLKRAADTKTPLSEEEASKANYLCADGVCKRIITKDRHPHAFLRGTIALQEIGAHLGKDASDVTASDIRNLRDNNPEIWKNINNKIQERLKTAEGDKYVYEEIDYDKMTSSMDRIAALKEVVAEKTGKTIKDIKAEDMHAYLDKNPNALNEVNAKLPDNEKYHSDKALHETAHRVSEYELFLQNNPNAKKTADTILAIEAGKTESANGAPTVEKNLWLKAEAQLKEHSGNQENKTNTDRFEKAKEQGQAVMKKFEEKRAEFAAAKQEEEKKKEETKQKEDVKTNEVQQKQEEKKQEEQKKAAEPAPTPSTPQNQATPTQQSPATPEIGTPGYMLTSTTPAQTGPVSPISLPGGNGAVRTV